VKGGTVIGALAAVLAVMLTASGVLMAIRWAGAIGDPAGTPPTAAPFLGGHPPQTHAWSRFHLRFYTMTLVFIAFEMEMMFMYPWAVVFVREGITALVEMGMFLLILSLGILYAWRERTFEWQ
jgi:NADH:ubiquinone oxidoreductase subunit 3 (subunit A)